MGVQERFGFFPPNGYTWVIEQGWVGFEEFSRLQPWYFLKESDMFFARERWLDGLVREELLAFARRQDNDDIACFDVAAKDKIVLIQGWTANGYDRVQVYSSFWEWMKSVIDDIAEWAEAS